MKDLRDVIAELEVDGYEMVRHRKHWVMRRPSDGATVVLPSTPSDRRAIDNIRSSRRRSEREALERSTPVASVVETSEVALRTRIALPARPAREEGRVIPRRSAVERKLDHRMWRISRFAADFRSGVATLGVDDVPLGYAINLTNIDLNTKPMTVPVVLDGEDVGRYVLDTGQIAMRTTDDAYDGDIFDDEYVSSLLVTILDVLIVEALGRGDASLVIDVIRTMWVPVDVDPDKAIAYAFTWMLRCLEGRPSGRAPVGLSSEELMAVGVQWSNEFFNWMKSPSFARSPLPRITHWSDIDARLDRYMVRTGEPEFDSSGER